VYVQVSEHPATGVSAELDQVEQPTGAEEETVAQSIEEADPEITDSEQKNGTEGQQDQNGQDASQQNFQNMDWNAANGFNPMMNMANGFNPIMGMMGEFLYLYPEF
jgi:hypothetical protein